MSGNVVERIFGEGRIRFREDGWFCATDAARMFNYELHHWNRHENVKELIIEIATTVDSNSANLAELEFKDALEMLTETYRGRYGSTWMHPDLAVPFAMAVNPKFGYWVTRQIKHILLDERHKIEQWHVARQGTKDANKFRNAQVDTFEGRATGNFVKYATELWFVVGGSWKERIIRNELSTQELTILQDIERIQAVLVEIQKDWIDVDNNFRRREILIARVNRLRQEVGLPAVDHGVFWTKAKEEYARKREIAERMPWSE